MLAAPPRAGALCGGPSALASDGRVRHSQRVASAPVVRNEKDEENQEEDDSVRDEDSGGELATERTKAQQ